MKNIFKLFLLIAAISLASCSNMSKQDTGTLSGGLIGGLIGSQFGGGGGQLVAIAAGTLAGAYIGGAIGKNMDDTDRLQMDRALDNNAVGEPLYWRNARSGARYEVVPTRNITVVGHRHRYCREYRTTAIIDGKKQHIYGTACRQRDGAWKAAKSR